MNLLKKDAIVLNLFEKEKGFLFGNDVFIGMENSVVKSVLTKNEATVIDVEKALYEIELNFNLLGLELKNNNSLPTDIVAQKIMEAYSPIQEKTDFDIVFGGEFVGEQAENHSTDSVNTTSTSIENNEENTIKNQTSFGDLLESIHLKKQYGETEIYQENENVSPEQIVDTLNSHKLTREEKRELTVAGVIDALNNGTTRLAEIGDVVRQKVEVSDTTIRNVLIQLTEEGKVNQLKRGIYELINSTELDEQKKNDNENNNFETASHTERGLISDPNGPTIQNPNELNETQNPECTVKEIKQSVPVTFAQNNAQANIPVEVEIAPAANFPPLFDNNYPIEEYLTEREVKPFLIKWILKYRTENAKRLRNAPQDIIDIIEKEPEYIGDVSVIEKCIIAFMRRTPLNLKGGAATGKTTLVRTLSAIMNLPLLTINGNLEANKATLVGEPAIDLYRRFIVKRGQLTKAMDREGFGGILYVDEINMMRPDILAILNPVTDGRDQFYNDVEKKTIFAHHNFHVVSAMNVGYAGVKKMNQATMDRPGAIKLHYPGKKEMNFILSNYAKKINKKGKEDGIPELKEVDIVHLTNIYLELVSAKNVPELARSARNFTLMADFLPIGGYIYAFQMWLDKFDDPEDAARVVGVLATNNTLDKIGVNKEELLNY